MADFSFPSLIYIFFSLLCTITRSFKCYYYINNINNKSFSSRSKNNQLLAARNTLHQSDLNNDYHNDQNKEKKEILQNQEVFMNNKVMKRKDVYKYIARTTTTTTAAAAAFTLSINKNKDKALAITSTKEESSYPIQKTDEEWLEILSPKQYDILRRGGTERPHASILEKETRTGRYKCAGCDIPLFSSKDKFNSGTGWPSFANAIKGGGVEVENVSEIKLNLLGAELKCNKCGGHLGHVFNDGFLFVGTPAIKSGKRFCIDGYALIFETNFGLEELRGDT